MADWPHDPDGDAGSEGRRKYGHAIVAKKVDDTEDFPLEAVDFLAEYGEDPVRIDDETVVSVADVFEHVPDDAEFESFPALHRAVGRSMRSAGYWPYRLESA